MGRPIIPFVAAKTCVEALSASEFKQEIARCLNFPLSNGITLGCKQHSLASPVHCVKSLRFALYSECKDWVWENGRANFTDMEVYKVKPWTTHAPDDVSALPVMVTIPKSISKTTIAIR